MIEEPKHAVVVGVQLPDVSDEEHASSLAELTRLAKTLGLDVIARVTQKRFFLSKGAVVGRGKLMELAKLTGGTGVVPSGAAEVKKRQAYGPQDEADDEEEEEEEEYEELASDTSDSERDVKVKATVVLVDHDLSPTQARNLERATSAIVMDRTSVILAIFQRHARSREAKLQVEIARLKYMTPRLRETGGGGDRQRGGIGGSRGSGQSAVELDRRKVRDRIAELRRELEDVQSTSEVRRRRRNEMPTAALVGYTNAGKSSLMRALTGSGVYVADKLFATLDTTVRALQPETRPRILISDTVGFIKKLPHDLVASFRSTLEEAAEADLLLHVVDASDGAFPQQIEVTRQVLGEVGVSSPSIVLLNKIDRVSEEGRDRLSRLYPDAFLLSAKNPEDIVRLRERLIAHFEEGMVEQEIFVPYTEQQRVSAIHDRCRVLSEHHGEEGTTMRVRAKPETLEGL